MKLLKLAIVAIFLLSGFLACKKTALPTTNVSNSDAASMLAGSLSSSSYGVNNITLDVSASAQIAVNTKWPCGSIVTDTMTRQNMAGTPYTYYYKLNYTHKLTCNASSLPDNISTNVTYAGNFSNSQIYISNSGTTSSVIAGLTSTATAYSLNGEYKSMGNFKLKSDTSNYGTANVDIVVKSLTISKSTQVITGGTATLIVTGTTFKKGDFTYNGTLTFNGNAMATMALNGVNYTINLVTGGVVKK